MRIKCSVTSHGHVFFRMPGSMRGLLAHYPPNLEVRIYNKHIADKYMRDIEHHMAYGDITPGVLDSFIKLRWRLPKLI